MGICFSNYLRRSCVCVFIRWCMPLICSKDTSIFLSTVFHGGVSLKIVLKMCCSSLCMCVYVDMKKCMWCMYLFSWSVWSQFVLVKNLPKGDSVGYLVIGYILIKQIFKQDVVWNVPTLEPDLIVWSRVSLCAYSI
jgi:hypothetical protein